MQLVSVAATWRSLDEKEQSWTAALYLCSINKHGEKSETVNRLIFPSVHWQNGGNYWETSRAGSEVRLHCGSGRRRDVHMHAHTRTHSWVRSVWRTGWSWAASCTAAPRTAVSWTGGIGFRRTTCRHRRHPSRSSWPAPRTQTNNKHKDGNNCYYDWWYQILTFFFTDTQYPDLVQILISYTDINQSAALKNLLVNFYCDFPAVCQEWCHHLQTG